jgi:hypothetical protein
MKRAGIAAGPLRFRCALTYGLVVQSDQAPVPLYE